MTNTDHSAVTAWLHGRLPESWSALAPPAITIDRDEITIVVSLECPRTRRRCHGRRSR